jgi:large subunit ribosomal protein L3
MAVGLLGRKVGMTQIYDPTGKVIPVTVIQAGPCPVLQLRTEARDGYEAVQLGYLDKPRRLASRSARGHVAKLDSKRQKQRAAAGGEAVPKADCEPKRFVREFRASVEGVHVGDEFKVDVFRPALEDLPRLLEELAKEHNIPTDQPGWQDELQRKEAAKYQQAVKSIKAVDVVGTSKGRGTAGVMKRHNFRGQRASHGVKKVHRHMGGTGCSASPSRLFKGKKMAGQYGNARCTARNLKVVQIDVDNNLLVVRGAIPGPNGGYVMIRETNRL